MTDISFTMDNTSQVAVAPINADATLKQAGGNTMVFAGIVVSQKGKPFEVIRVNADNWMAKLGKPLHSSVGKHADGMRSLDEAVRGGEGLVVRIVPATATYAAVSMALVENAVTTTNEAINYATALDLGESAFAKFAIKDGADSDNRQMKIEAADVETHGAGMFVITLSERTVTGDMAELESKVVSFDPLAVDSMGAPAFAETVFESSQYLECRVSAAAKTAIAAAELPLTVSFTGASNGDVNTIAADDYLKAIAKLKETVQSFNYVCGLSCYDAGAIRELTEMCKAKRISGYFDVDPRLSHEQGEEFKRTLGINNMRASFVHLPYTAKCRFYGNRAVWGASGIGFAAKAAGVAKTSPIGGWHYTPAGSERATINRTGLTPAPWAGESNPQEMYKVRLNKLATDENGNLFIDDSLTSHSTENYLRFEQVVSLMDAISRDFYALGNRLKHQPDGVTLDGLKDGMKDTLEGYEAVGALVKPRNPEDGEAPWKFTVTQVEIDLWEVTWWACPTGSARRIMGQPILLR